jgi:hypothetical protein
MVGIIEDTGVDGNDRGPIQSADDIDRPMQDAAMTVDFSQNSRPAAASTDSAGALNRNCLDFLFPAMLVARPSAFLASLVSTREPRVRARRTGSVTEK